MHTNALRTLRAVPYLSYPAMVPFLWILWALFLLFILWDFLIVRIFVSRTLMKMLWIWLLLKLHALLFVEACFSAEEDVLLDLRSLRILPYSLTLVWLGKNPSGRFSAHYCNLTSVKRLYRLFFILSKSLFSMLLRIDTRADCILPQSLIVAFDIFNKEIVSFYTCLGPQLFGDRRLRAQMYHIRVVEKECVSVARHSWRSCIKCLSHLTKVPLLSTVRKVFKAVW